MTKGTCGRCRWWGDVDEFHDNYGSCGGPAFVGTYCGELADRRKTNAIVDYEGMRQTGRDFGCIHWEERQEESDG